MCTIWVYFKTKKNFDTFFGSGFEPKKIFNIKGLKAKPLDNDLGPTCLLFLNHGHGTKN